MKNQTFVFAHDQQIIVDFIANNKFHNLDNLKYVFLGSGAIDKIENLNNVIISRHYVKNIEEWNKTLIAYTGWYMLWKNNLIEAEYVNLLEYDIIVTDNMQSSIYQTLDTYTDIESISYQPLGVHEYWFLGADLTAKALLDSIQKHHGLDGRKFISEFSNDVQVGVTSNQTLKKTTFDSFMEWMEPIIEDIKEDRMAGHYPERSLPLYILYKDAPAAILTGVLSHFRLDSHSTQGMPEQYKKENYNKILKS
jgi:hypothetical protein